MRRTSSRVALALSFIVIAWGCSDSTPSESIALSLSTNSLAMAQGGSQQITVTVQRSNFEQPVTLSIQGQLPAGVSAEFAQSSLPAGVSTTVLTVEVAGNAAPTTGASFTVRASGEGVAEQTQDVTVSVAITGTYTLGLLEPQLSVAQGGGGNATVLVTRNNGNAGDVALSVGPLPAGVTATFAQTPTTAGAGSLIIAASSGVAPGTYPITITSSSPGHTPNQTTTLSLVVAPAPATASASVAFCPAGMPAWFAYRNEGFGWQPLSASGNTFTFNATERVAVAFAFASGGSSDLNVYHVHRSELAYFNADNCSGSRSYTGEVSGLTTGQSALVSMWLTNDLPDASSPSYVLADLPNRPLDLVAARGIVTNQSLPSPDRIIVRRGIDVTTGSVLPELNFTGPESFAPASASLTVSNVVQGSSLTVLQSLLTSVGTFAILQLARTTSTPTTIYFVPADKLIASDLHETYVDAAQANGLARQGYVEYSTVPGDRSVSLGPEIAVATVTMVPGASFSRPRASFASQSEYASVALAVFVQFPSLGSERAVTTAMTDAYFGGTPQQWDLLLPDFSGAPGFDTGWMLASDISTSYATQAFGGPNDVVFGGTPEAGESYRFVSRQSMTTSLRILRSNTPIRRALRRASLTK